MSSKISQLPAASALTGAEQIPVVQGGSTVVTTAQALLNLVISAAPGTLDTLKELADAIGDDQNFAATMAAALAGKATASQGAKADTALQPAAIGTTVQGYSAATTVLGNAFGSTAGTFAQGNDGRLALAATAVQPATLTETPGTKLRRLARLAGDGNNAKDRPYMKAIPPWQPSAAWGQYDQCVNGGNIYSCVTAGTSAATGGPTAVIGSTVYTDGSAAWTYYGPNGVTADPSLTQTAWVASTAYTLAAQVLSGGNVYACVVAGTSTTTTLAGTGNAIADGTAKWTYLGVYQANPYAGVFPIFTIGTGAPSGLSNAYYPDSGSFTALGVQPVAAGSGYAVGDTITPTGGTYTTQAVFTVTSVVSGGVTGLRVTTPGLYTTLVNTFPTTQGSTSGSGTGCTVAIRFSNGTPHFNFRNGYLGYQSSAGFAGMYTFTPTPNASPVRQHPAFDFYTDAPAFALQFSGQNGQCVIIDGVRYNQGSLGGTFSGNHYFKFDFTNTGGRKKRHILVQSIGYVAFGSIWVDVNSQVWRPDDSDKIVAVLISDSTFAGSGYGPFQAGNTVAHNLSNELGWSNVQDFSLGGTGYCNRGTSPGTGTDVFGTRVAEAALLKPDVWLIAGSVNDRGSSFTNAQITTAATALYQAIRATGSMAPIIVVGTWSINDTGATVTLAMVEADLQAAIAAAADPLGKTFYLPVYGDTPLPWVTGTWNNTKNTNSTNGAMYINGGDNIHPVDIGTRYFSARLAAAVRGVLPSIP